MEYITVILNILTTCCIVFVGFQFNKQCKLIWKKIEMLEESRDCLNRRYECLSKTINNIKNKVIHNEPYLNIDIDRGYWGTLEMELVYIHVDDCFAEHRIKIIEISQDLCEKVLSNSEIINKNIVRSFNKYYKIDFEKGVATDITDIYKEKEDVQEEKSSKKS